ncbi:hypothetical protein ANCDUO_09505, partial [Ancylostoma duodenale]
RRQQISKKKSIFIFKKFQLAVRGKNKKEVVESLWKRFTQSADEVLLSGQRDVDDFFEHERNYLVEYNTHIKDAASKAEKVVKLRKSEFPLTTRFCFGFVHLDATRSFKLWLESALESSCGLWELSVKSPLNVS